MQIAITGGSCQGDKYSGHSGHSDHGDKWVVLALPVTR